jgi:hypothetical protein
MGMCAFIGGCAAPYCIKSDANPAIAGQRGHWALDGVLKPLLIEMGVSMAVPAIFDVIVFKDGNLVNGKVLTHSFCIKTSYGEIIVKKKDIANIHMRGIQFKADQIITLDLNRFKGSLQEATIRMKLKDGQNIEVAKNKINTIMMLTNYRSA